MKNASSPCARPRKASPWTGLKAARIPGCAAIAAAPSAAIAVNQRRTIGPKTKPTPEAPLNWMAKSAMRSPSVIGTAAPAQPRNRDAEALDRRKHADRRRDHAVADEKPGARHQRPEQHAHAAVSAVVQEAVEREHSALAVVLGA